MDVLGIISFVLVMLTKKLRVTAYECTTSESVTCKQEIQDLREDMGRYYYANDNNALAEMCRKQILAVNCVNSFARECLSEEEQAYFKTLVLGSDKFLDALCSENSELKQAYLRHSSCIRNVSKDLDACSQQYQAAQRKLDGLQDDSEILVKKTCCIYFENIHCSSNVTVQMCGEEASKLVSQLLTLLSGTYLTERCKPYSKYDTASCTLISGSALLTPSVTLWTMLIVFYALKQRLK